MLRVITGDDSYRVTEHFKAALNEGAVELEGLSDETSQMADSVSLFGALSYVVRLRSLDDCAYELLEPFIKASNSLTVYAYTIKNGSTAKAVRGEGKVNVIRLDKLSREALAKQVSQRAVKGGCRISASAFSQLLAQTAYLESDEVDLGNVLYETDRIADICREEGQIRLEDVKKFGNVFPLANAFSWVDAVAGGDVTAAVKLAEVIVQERDFNALRTLSLLEQRFMRSWKASLLSGGYAAKCQEMGVKSFKSCAPELAKQALEAIIGVKRAIKQGESESCAFISATYSVAALVGKARAAT